METSPPNNNNEAKERFRTTIDAMERLCELQQVPIDMEKVLQCFKNESFVELMGEKTIKEFNKISNFLEFSKQLPAKVEALKLVYTQLFQEDPWDVFPIFGLPTLPVTPN